MPPPIQTEWDTPFGRSTALNFVAADELWQLADEAEEEVENLPEVVPHPLPVETPADIGQRLADAATIRRKRRTTLRVAHTDSGGYITTHCTPPGGTSTSSTSSTSDER